MAAGPEYVIEPLDKSNHDRAAFDCGFEELNKYIKGRADWDASKRVSLVFVVRERDSNVVIGYYTLSNLSVVLSDLPDKLKKGLPRYPQIGTTLLGRLAVDKKYSKKVAEETGEKPRLGELLLYDAQRRVLEGSKEISSSYALVIEVLEPTEEDKKIGVRDPMAFYEQYGFQPFPGNARRVYKLTKVIEKEFS